MLFFSKEISGLNKAYASLFGIEDEDDKDQEGNARDSDEDEGTEEDDSSVSDDYSRKWGWLAMVDTVSEITRLNWQEVFKLSVIEFLNIACYARDKAEHEKQQVEAWKRTHGV